MLSISLPLVVWSRAVPRPAARNQATRLAAAVTDRGSATTAAPKRTLMESYGRLPISFEAYRQREVPSAKFVARGAGYTVYLGSDDALFAFRSPSKSAASGGQPLALLHMKLLGTRRDARVAGLDELPGKVNRFTGADPARWRRDVPTDARVKYEGVYRGVDLVYYGNQRQLEYDFVVAPGADPGTIRFRLTGAPRLRLDAEGNLIIRTGAEARLKKPVAYQEAGGIRRPVAANYVLADKNVVGFRLEPYDHTKPLVIDPVFVYSTLLGGSGNDFAIGIAADAEGNAYVTGATAVVNGGEGDGFVTKLSPAGNLIYTTYLQGTDGASLAYAIAVDRDGNAYVGGLTQSTDFPITPGAFQTTHVPGRCNPPPFGLMGGAFVTKINATGDALVYSTFVGSGACTVVNDIAVDSSGDAYITGWSGSGIPTTPGAFQPGTVAFSAFVTKLNASGTALVYSTYLGGSNHTLGEGIAVDAAGNAYVAGVTNASDFPVTPGALQSAFRSVASCTDGPTSAPSQAFVTKVNATGSALIYSTLLGGSGCEGASGIAVDASGNAYVVGSTTSADFPVTSGAFQTTFGGGAADAFVAKVNPTGTALVYSSYLGGSGFDRGGGMDLSDDGLAPGTSQGIAIDGAGNAYVTGCTASPDFPLTADAMQASLKGTPFPSTCDDAFLAIVTGTGSGLTYSTLLGGDNYDAGNSLALDSAGNVLIAGQTLSSNFPTTAGALAPFPAGGWDAFVAKVTFYSAQVQPPIAANGSSIFKANRNGVPVKFTLTQGGQSTCALPPATISLLRTSGVTVGAVNEADYLVAADAGSAFRIDTANCQYVYNLGTGSLGTGAYVVEIKIGGATVGSAVFGLQ